MTSGSMQGEFVRGHHPLVYNGEWFTLLINFKKICYPALRIMHDE